MSDNKNFRIELNNVSKRYNIYDRPTDRLKELLLRNRKSYHREFWALKDLTIGFEQCTTAVLGPNGSGKSTLMQLIAGVLQPTEGSVRINGRLTAILELGAGFQSEFSGRENVLMNGMMLGIPEEEMEARLDEIAAFADIGDFFDQPTKTYSSGMIVRLAFAAAVSVDPDILIVDEALAVGDKRFQWKCILKMNELMKHGKTVVFVTHNIDLVQKRCQKALLLNGGKMLAYGDTEEIVPLYERVNEDPEYVIPKTFSEAPSPA